MRKAIGPLKHPYVLGLLAPALVLNLAAIFALAVHQRAAGAEIVAEVEILDSGCSDQKRREQCYWVRLTRVLRGSPEDSVLRARFPAELRPHGLGTVSWPGPSFAAGERLLVVMGRGHDCHYRVSQLWLGSGAAPRADGHGRRTISAAYPSSKRTPVDHSSI